MFEGSGIANLQTKVGKVRYGRLQGSDHPSRRRRFSHGDL